MRKQLRGPGRGGWASLGSGWDPTEAGPTPDGCSAWVGPDQLGPGDYGSDPCLAPTSGVPEASARPQFSGARPGSLPPGLSLTSRAAGRLGLGTQHAGNCSFLLEHLCQEEALRGLRFPECNRVVREGRGEGTVGRRPRWVAAAAAAIVPAPRVSVRGSVPGRGLGRKSRSPGRLEPPLRVPGRPLPSSLPPSRRPEAARGPGHVSRAAPPPAGPLRRRRGETASQAFIQAVECTWRQLRTALGSGLFLLSRPFGWGSPGPAPSGLTRPARVTQALQAGQWVDPSPSSCYPPAKDPGMGKRPPAHSGVSTG